MKVGLVRSASLCFLSLAVCSSWSFAVPLEHDDFDAFLQKSKSDPKRVYVLKVSATWCHPCSEEAKALTDYAKDANDGVTRAYWNEVETDKLPDGQYDAFIKKMGIPADDTLPFNIVFKNGVPIGSMTGFNMESLKKFVSDAEAYDPGSDSDADAGAKLIPKFPCGPRDATGACVLGISGYEGKGAHDTDDFGRSNLKMFANLFKSKK